MEPVKHSKMLLLKSASVALQTFEAVKEIRGGIGLSAKMYFSVNVHDREKAM